MRPCGIAASRISFSRNGEATETRDAAADQQADDGEAAAVGAEEAQDAAQPARGCSFESAGGGVQVEVRSGCMGSFGGTRWRAVAATDGA